MDFTGVVILLFLIACMIVLAVSTLATGLLWWLRRRAGKDTALWWRRHCLGSCAALLMTGIALGVASAVLQESRYRATIRFIENEGVFLLWLLPVAMVWWFVARLSRAGRA